MNPNLIDDYLKGQSELTAVEKFSSRKDFRQIPVGETVYRELIPKTAPGPGQQYAFAVDLDRCTGCKACVTACHNENGLEEGETWRSVGLIHGGTLQQPTLQHVTTACHHCIDPGCLSGCPVQAYEKDPDTGIVKHLEDQCFGCQYCTFTCPYDVPKYIPSKGIVHKCDMCQSRLKVGESPACVRACPSQAIQITLVDINKVRESPSEYVKIPEAPDSNWTIPTTIYKTTRNLPTEMVSSDFYTLQPEHAHWPLVLMLVLTQLSAGAFFLDWIIKFFIPAGIYQILTPGHLIVAFLIGQLALAASVFHLGRPLYAFRALIGLRTSWLSREILIFSIFAVFSTVYSLGPLFFSPIAGNPILIQFLSGTTAFFGIAGVLASIMVYRKTHRPFWDNRTTVFKFLLTSCILGASTVMVAAIALTALHDPQKLTSIVKAISQPLCQLIVAATIIKLTVESFIFMNLKVPTLNSLKKTALLLTGPLQKISLGRYSLGIFGGILLPAFLWKQNPNLSPTSIIILSVFIFILNSCGELLERYLFFRAVVPLKMPGERLP